MFYSWMLINQLGCRRFAWDTRSAGVLAAVRRANPSLTRCAFLPTEPGRAAAAPIPKSGFGEGLIPLSDE
jgi:hypothetical protein